VTVKVRARFGGDGVEDAFRASTEVGVSGEDTLAVARGELVGEAGVGEEDARREDSQDDEVAPWDPGRTKSGRKRPPLHMPTQGYSRGSSPFPLK